MWDPFWSSLIFFQNEIDQLRSINLLHAMSIDCVSHQSYHYLEVLLLFSRWILNYFNASPKNEVYQIQCIIFKNFFNFEALKFDQLDHAALIFFLDHLTLICLPWYSAAQINENLDLISDSLMIIFRVREVVINLPDSFTQHFHWRFLYLLALFLKIVNDPINYLKVIITHLKETRVYFPDGLLFFKLIVLWKIFV